MNLLTPHTLLAVIGGNDIGSNSTSDGIFFPDGTGAPEKFREAYVPLMEVELLRLLLRAQQA